MKNCWNHRLKANQITAPGWDYQFMMIRIGFDNLIQQGSTIIIISCCIRVSNKIAQSLPHTQSRQPIGINDKTSRGQKARGTSRIDGWITLMKWRGKIVEGDKIIRIKEWKNRIARRTQNDWQKRLNGLWLFVLGRFIPFHQSGAHGDEQKSNFPLWKSA